MVEKDKNEEIKADDDGNEEVRSEKSFRGKFNENENFSHETCSKTANSTVFGKTVTLPMLLKSGILVPGEKTMSIEYMVNSNSN